MLPWRPCAPRWSELGAERVAAFYVEPIQGSGGVLVPPKGWMKAMRDVCRELDILFVADEVITGFGRTGPLFACSKTRSCLIS